MQQNSVPVEELKNGGELFESFWLRPKLFANQSVMLRLRVNKKWGGWKLKDELVRGLGLEVGETITTEVTPLLTPGKIDAGDDMDLFAIGEGADWLLEQDVGIGTIIDCRVRFSYEKVPVGPNGKNVYKASLIFEQGFNVVGIDDEYDDSGSTGDRLLEILKKLQN